MNECREHGAHDHKHGKNCGHRSIKHGDHEDFLHEGHLHFKHGEHYDEHQLEISEKNPSNCTAGHTCPEHEKGHAHGEGCGHEKVPHGDHFDFLVNDHLHHSHNGHCDNHGTLH